MYLRETKRTNRDGGTVSCLQLAHNRRDPQTGVPKAEIIHSFGRADHIDREGLARLVRSISRFLEQGESEFKSGLSAPATHDLLRTPG